MVAVTRTPPSQPDGSGSIALALFNIQSGCNGGLEAALRAYPHAKSSWEHDTRLDKTQEQRLQDASVNVGGYDLRETLWTASCRFALALRERDEAMMLSQLTFHESESFDQGRRSEGGDCLISFVPLFAWRPFLFSLSGSHSLSR